MEVEAALRGHTAREGAFALGTFRAQCREGSLRDIQAGCPLMAFGHLYTKLLGFSA